MTRMANQRFMIRRIFALAVLTLLWIAAAAQVLVTPPNEKLLQGRVKQVEEFISRFNLDETWQGRRTENPADTALRAKYIATLFDADRFSDGRGHLSPEALQFVSQVVGGGWRLNFEDTTWVAEVVIDAALAQKPQRIKMYLATQRMAPYEYCWVVKNVSGAMFDVPAPENPYPVLSPIDHETGFMRLLDISYSDGRFTQMFGPDYHPDRLSMLAVLLKNRLLQLDKIASVRFHFFTVPGWSFTIERKEKKGSFNTGWLISKLNKME